MKRGILLPAGGAKGAFQAGAIYGLNEQGIKFQVISGTSVGAVNGYCLYKNALDAMKMIWMNMNEKTSEKIVKSDSKVRDNRQAIGILKAFADASPTADKFFTNYIEVQGGRVQHKIDELGSKSAEEQLQGIKYSSLLPNIQSETGEEYMMKFMESVKKGEYDGFKLDGSLVHPVLWEPFIEERVDEIYCITCSEELEIPEEILDCYTREQIIIVSPQNEFQKGDTFNFSKEACRKRFEEGLNLFRQAK